MMLVRRFYDSKLAQASYLIGSLDTRDAVVIDPNREIDQYVRAAAEENVRITHVTETHIHADFVSGSRELAARTGARLLLSDEGGADWRYAFAKDAGAVLLKDGDAVDVGTVRLDVWHTPGHTPEHITFLVTDTGTASEPMAAVTGDFVFVGDVGRPDLLERAARVAGTMTASARDLYRSLQRFKQLPDFLQIWPGHGAGSACGKSLGAVPQSTLGYERRFNWAFQAADEEAFITRVLAGQPDPPRYFAEMKRVNKAGPAPRPGELPAEVPAAALPALLDDGALVIDTRPAGEFGQGHLPGTLNIALTRAFLTWAGWLVPYDRDVYLIAASRAAMSAAVADLALIGVDRVRGYALWDDVRRTLPAGETIEQIGARDVEAARQREDVTVLDVRSDAEWREGHVPGARHIPLGELPHRVGELPGDGIIVVHCLGGTRSAIAASLLQAHGRRRTVNFAGGFNEWTAAGLPTTTGETPA